MIHTPSTRSVLASAMTFTKPSGSRLVLARLLASIGNLPTLTSPCLLRLLLGEADAGDLGHGVDDRRDHVVVHDAGLAGDVLGDGDALVLGLVGEHRAGDDVADRPDARHLGAEIVVGLDLAALVGLKPGLVEREAVGVGLAADRDEDDVGFDRLGRAAGGGLDGRG